MTALPETRIDAVFQQVNPLRFPRFLEQVIRRYLAREAPLADVQRSLTPPAASA